MKASVTIGNRGWSGDIVGQPRWVVNVPGPSLFSGKEQGRAELAVNGLVLTNLVEFMPDPEPELKPCPFCGGEARLIASGISGHAVICMNCGDGRTDSYATEAEAIAAWNRRAAPEREDMWKGKPFSQLSEAELREAWDYFRSPHAIWSYRIP